MARSSAHSPVGGTPWRLAVPVLLVACAIPANGCFCDPPGFGTFVLGVRTYVPADARLVLPGGEGETLEGLTSVVVTIERVDVVHRTVLDDPSTEEVLTIDDEPHTVIFATTLEDTSNGFIGEFSVPAGFVLQGRLVLSDVRMTLRGEEHIVEIPSGAESGLKFDPIDGVPFEMIADEKTGARLLFEPFDQLLRNRGRGFLLKPLARAEHAAVERMKPSNIMFDRVIVRFEDGTPQGVIDAEIAAAGASVLSRWVPTSFYVLRLPITMDVFDGLSRFDTVPSVAYTAPDAIMGFDQNDPLFSQQTHWPQASVDLAYAGGAVGSYFPVIAIVDSGIAYDHPDLVDNIWINVAEAPAALTADADMDTFMDGDFDADGFLTFADLNSMLADTTLLAMVGLSQPVLPSDLIAVSTNGIDEDGNCPPGNDDSGDGVPCSLGDKFVDDVVGWDFEDGDNTPNDETGHGTTMASIAGAVGDNGIDMTGVSQRVRLLPVRVDTAESTLGTATMAGPIESSTYEAALYAAAVGAHVVNMSFGQYVSSVERGACKRPGAFELEAADFASFTSRLDATLSDIHNNLGGAMLVTSAGNCLLNHDLPEIYVWPSGDGPNDTGTATAHVRVAWVENTDAPAVRGGGEGTDFGPMTVDVAAPGSELIALDRAGGVVECFSGTSIECTSGTSPAAAFFSGIAGLVLEEDRMLAFDACNLADRLIRNADPIGALMDTIASGARVNANAAVLNLVTTPFRSCP